MEIDVKREKVKKWATVGLIGLTGLIVSPVIFLAIKGLIGLIVAGLIAVTVVTFSPWMSMKFANWKVKSIVAEAKENPIETMINLLAAKREAFKVFEQSVVTASTAAKNFKIKCDQFAMQYPARAPEFQKQLASMNSLVSRKTEALKAAQRSLIDGEHKLTEMKAYWDMSQAAQAANAAAGMDTGDAYEALKADTAVDAVFESMNKAFSELEVAAALNPDDKYAGSTTQLEHSTPTVLETQVVTVKETLKVKSS